MNRLRSLLVLSLTVVFMLFSSCDKEPDVVEDFLRCTLDGQAWTASSAVYGTVADPLIVIDGVNQHGDTLRLLIQDQQPGTYQVKNTQNVTIFKTAGKTYIPLNSADASLTITKHDVTAREIEGSFYLTLDGGQGDWKALTGGAFKVCYH